MVTWLFHSQCTLHQWDVDWMEGLMLGLCSTVVREEGLEEFSLMTLMIGMQRNYLHSPQVLSFCNPNFRCRHQWECFAHYFHLPFSMWANFCHGLQNVQTLWFQLTYHWSTNERTCLFHQSTRTGNNCVEVAMLSSTWWVMKIMAVVYGYCLSFGIWLAQFLSVA